VFLLAKGILYCWALLTCGVAALPQFPQGESPVSRRTQLASNQMEGQLDDHSPQTQTQRVVDVVVFYLFGAPWQDLMHDGETLLARHVQKQRRCGFWLCF
jgi:hypothetical protein